MNRVVRVLLVIGALVLATACGAQPASTGGSGTSPAGGGDQLNFTSRTLDGREFSGQELAGKPAVLWFWSPWCTICQREAPTVAEAARANPAVRFVGVAAQDQIPAMQTFVDRYGMGSFAHLADTDASVWRRFGVTAQPAFAFVGADGRVDVVRGGLSEQELGGRLTALSGKG